MLLGQAMPAAALVLSLLGAGASGAVTVSLILLEPGWSASTAARSVLVSRAGAPEQRPRIQGLSGMLMNIAGAVGGASAGLILTASGFGGLAGVLRIPVLVVVLLQLRSRLR